MKQEAFKKCLDFYREGERVKLKSGHGTFLCTFLVLKAREHANVNCYSVLYAFSGQF